MFFHFHIANFFRFIAAYLSFTHFVTWAKPLYHVYCMPCFSFCIRKDTLYFLLSLVQVFCIWRMSGVFAIFT